MAEKFRASFYSYNVTVEGFFYSLFLEHMYKAG